MAEPFVRMEGVHKSFGSVAVLRGVNLELFTGETHALLGENGAGKSTLMKILSGSYGDYEGQVFVDGKPVQFASPAEAARAGISIIHQELSAFPELTVAENFVVGRWPRGGGGAVDWARIEREAAEWLEKCGLKLPPGTRMGELPVGQQQLVEIAKALSRDAKVIILDEPTSSLGPQEAARLFGLMKQLKGEGKALVYISHRMEEIFGQCDRVTVLRDGQSVLTAKITEVDEAKLVTAMVGRPLDRLFPEKPARPGQRDIILDVREFRATGRAEGSRSLGPLDFTLRRGEILGFAGLLGSGRSELLRALLGDESYNTTGSITYLKKARTWDRPADAYASGVVLVNEDRRRDSLLPTRSIEENSSILRLSLAGILKAFNPAKEARTVYAELERLRTARRDDRQLITELSGGNQQKVIFSRVLQTAPTVVVLDEPTRGVDVGAKLEIYQILFSLAQSGLGVLLVSSDLPELMALSDRVVVLSEGRQTGTLEGKDITEDRIMALAVGRATA